MRQTLQSTTKMIHSEAQRSGLAKHHSPIRWIYLCLLLAFFPFAYGAPFLNESSALNSTESDQDLFELIQKFTTPRPVIRSANTIRPIQISNKQWHRMIDNGPMITRLAFDVGTPFRPTYAYVTPESYDKYAMDLERKCRKIQDDNIADKQLDSLDNGYFKWEDHEFNKALLKALFPETVHGDHRRFLSTPKVVHQIRLSRSIESQCQRVEQKDDWSAQIDERTNVRSPLITILLLFFETHQKDNGMAELFKGTEIVLSDGCKLKAEEHLKDKVVALYFSAVWCPPCCTFTPKLKEFYEKLAASGKNFEVVFVSRDRSEEALVDYYKNHHGKWVYLPFGSPKIEELSKQFKVKFIPSVLVFDVNGKLIVQDAYEQVIHYRLASIWKFDWERANETLEEIYNSDEPKTKRRKVDYSEKNVECEKCKRKFLRIKDYNTHVCEKKPSTKPKNQKCKLLNKDGVECESAYVVNQVLYVHIMADSHFGVKFCCVLCNSGDSVGWASLPVHLRDTHAPKITCLHCNEEFSRSKFDNHKKLFEYEIECMEKRSVYSLDLDKYLEGKLKEVKIQQLVDEVNSAKFKSKDVKKCKIYTFHDPRLLPSLASNELSGFDQFTDSAFYAGRKQLNYNRNAEHVGKVRDQANRTDKPKPKVAQMLDVFAAGRDIVQVEIEVASEELAKMYEAGVIQALNSCGKLTNEIRGNIISPFLEWSKDRSKLAKFGCGIVGLLYDEFCSSVLQGNIKSVSQRLAKESNLIPRYIGTHNGKFQCDDVFACYMLKLLPEFKNHQILRTRNEAELAVCDAIIDVGRLFNHEKKRYDYHESTFAETMNSLSVLTGNNKALPYFTKLSSAGLVYFFYGKEVIRCVLGETIGDDRSNFYFDKLYKDFVEAVDASASKVKLFESNYSLNTIQSLVEDLNPAWNDKDANEDAQFIEAMQMVGKIFTRKVLYIHNDWMPCRQIVERALLSRDKIHESGRVMLLPESCPWKEHFFMLEKQFEIDGEVIYVIYPGDSTKTNWHIEAIPVSESSEFDNRCPLPEKWRGKRDEELSQIAGIKDAVFVHATGFIGGAKSKDETVKMAVKALNIQGII